LCADVLSWTSPDTAAELVGIIADVGRGWLKTSRFTPDRTARPHHLAGRG